jgi:transcriptional regulator with PAS, ATPase and Fis domain
VQRFAASDSTLLLTGETGTGKEILAHSIHRIGPRRRQPFVSINCAALPENLLESELFGYEEGAFTGSRRGGKPGLFEIAHKGTIFLDEIGATPQSVQTRLLRVLQEKEVMRIGGERMIPVDVRIIAATNKDVTREVQKGNIREDLFFRLNILHIHIPPLRDRMDDLPVLMKALMKKTAKKYQRAPLTVPSAFLASLMAYSWPGNVRQLENFVERLLLLSSDRFRQGIFDELYSELTAYTATGRPFFNKELISGRSRAKGVVQNQDTRSIWRALEEAHFCKSKAAKRLGISRTTLWRKLKEAPYPSESA